VREIATVLVKKCLHHQCSKGNCCMQDATLFKTTKAAAPPPHGEEVGQPGGARHYFVCVHPQLYNTHQQLLHYNALHPRVLWI
jgi:hypothetical protein